MCDLSSRNRFVGPISKPERASVGIHIVFCIRLDIGSLINKTGGFGPTPKCELEVIRDTKIKQLRHGSSEVRVRRPKWTFDGVLATEME